MCHPVYTPERLSERAGRAFADLAVLDMLNQTDQNVAIIFETALLEFRLLPCRAEAARGFTEGMMGVLKLALTARRISEA
jgi:hypothetical protein